MALSVVGYGTRAEGNNTSITMALPSGIQAGDLLVVFGYIKENGAIIWMGAGNTDWSLLITGNAGLNDNGNFIDLSGENRFAIFKTIYQPGVTTTPTLDFVGGGANDTTMGCVMAVRSSTGAGIVAKPNAQSSTYGQSGGGYSFTTWGNYQYCPKPGQLGVEHSVVAADFPSGGIIHYSPAFGYTKTTSGSYYYSVLGSDASAAISTWSPNRELLSNEYNQTLHNYAPSGSDLMMGVAFVLTETLQVDVLPAGGASAGGTAAHSFLPAGTFDAPVPTGGASAGGTAVTSVLAPGLRQIKASAKAAAQSTASLNVSWDSSGLDGDSLLILQVVTVSNGNPTPVTPSGWTKISSGTSNDSSVYWRRYQAGDPTSVTVTFTTDDSSSAKAGLVNFFKNTDWSKNGGNPFGPEYRTSGAGGGYLGFPIATTTPTAILSLRGITSNAGTYLVVGGETWIDLEKSGASLTYYCECRAALIPLTTSTRASNTQAQSFYSATNAGHEANTYSINVLQEGGPTDYAYTASGGASVGGAATTIPPATPADYPWTASGGMVLGGLSATISFNPGPAPRKLSGLTLSWPTVRRLIGADRTSFSLRLGAVTLRLRALRITRKLDSGNSIEAIIMSTTRPCNVGQELTAGIVTLSGSGQTLGERTWTVAVDRVTELEPGRQAWSVRATETTLRGGGLAWAPAKISMRTTTGARAAPDFNVVAGDTYNGRVIANVTTYIQAQGAGATEISYG